MLPLVQSLESRTLFSASTAAAVLLADAKQVAVAGGTARADLKGAQSAASANIKAATTDLKASTTSTNRVTNSNLLKTLKHDDQTVFATLGKDATALVAVSTSLAKHAAADGKALLLHPSSTTLQSKVTADLAALASEPAARLATLQTDAQNTTLGTDLTNIVNANPGNASLAADATAFQSGGSVAAAVASALTSAGAVTTATNTLNSDVSATTSATTIPNLVGTYVGTSTDINGNQNNQGLVSTITLTIATESSDGCWTGSAVSTIDGNTSTETQSLTGTVGADNSFTATVTGSNSSGQLVGTVSGTTISGSAYDGSGNATQSFVLTLQ